LLFSLALSLQKISPKRCGLGLGAKWPRPRPHLYLFKRESDLPTSLSCGCFACFHCTATTFTLDPMTSRDATTTLIVRLPRHCLHRRLPRPLGTAATTTQQQRHLWQHSSAQAAATGNIKRRSSLLNRFATEQQQQHQLYRLNKNTSRGAIKRVSTQEHCQ
jgi:hypothetical protein